jgi:integrin alpha FG-GAP repeat containing protein 1
LNGFSSSSEPSIDASLGGIYYGPSTECIVTTVLGNQFVAKGAQLSQAGYTPLELCYIYLGLGRTNNYVESLTAGITASYDS